MLKINLAYSSSTIHYKPMQWHCILLFPGPGMFAIRAPEEESSEMVEEMDTSEAVWCWYYLAECGVWHMFEVQDISLHLCIPHKSILLLDLLIHSFIIPSTHPIPSLTHSTHHIESCPVSILHLYKPLIMTLSFITLHINHWTKASSVWGSFVKSPDAQSEH